MIFFKCYDVSCSQVRQIRVVSLINLSFSLMT
jgi:hypothetical protein